MNKKNNEKKGRLFIVSAPSGAGKTTLCRAALKMKPTLSYSISYTTRDPRNGEVNGVDYHFISTALFKEGIQKGQWAEWAEVHGNYYATSMDFILEETSQGRDILLDIDVQGAMQIIEKYPEAVTIFIMPPSFETLRERLMSRGSDSEGVIYKRLQNAREEIAMKGRYNHIIINDILSEAQEALLELLERPGGI